MSDNLNTLIEQLKKVREDSASFSAAMSALKKEYQERLEADPEYADVMENLTGARSYEERLSEKIRQEALSLYSVDGNKKPHDAVQVKIFLTVSIPDENAAREWCFTNFRPALKLDAKTFEKAVKDGAVPAELATTAEEPRAQIASKLE